VTWLFRQLQTINFLSKQLPFVETFLCKHRAIKSFQQVCHICNSQTFNSVIKGHLKLLHVPLYYIILPAWRHFRKGGTNLHQFHKSCWVRGCVLLPYMKNYSGQARMKYKHQQWPSPGQVARSRRRRGHFFPDRIRPGPWPTTPHTALAFISTGQR